jgi:hypothetical protein
MSRTTHTMTVTFTVHSNAPEAGVDLDIESIEIDGEDICTVTSKATYAEASLHITNALNLLEGY